MDARLRGWVCLVALFVAVVPGAFAAGLAAPRAGLWRATGTEFKGTFRVSVDGRYVTGLHGTTLAAATNGCPVVRAGETLVIPGKLPISHVKLNDTYLVSGKNVNADEPFMTQMISGGHRHSGFIAISWATQPAGVVDITYGSLATGCHISFYSYATAS